MKTFGILLLFMWILPLSGRECILQVNGLLTESELRAKGFGDEEVSGMDAMDFYLKEVDGWRKRFFMSSRRTHLSFLEGLIDPHIEFIRQGILKQNTENTRRKLEILKMFEEEAHERRESGRVSYRWWVNFNYRLSILISAKKSETGPSFNYEKDWISDRGLEAHYAKDARWCFGRNDLHFSSINLRYFPKITLCPIKNGDIGYFTFNRFFTTRIYPLGLINKKTVADGLPKTPQVFFEHDGTHASSSDEAIQRLKGQSILEKRAVPFHRAFLQKMDTLPLEDRKNAEWVYFILSHESPRMLWKNKKQISTQEAIQSMHYPIEEKHILDFMDIMHEVERDLGW